MYCSSFLYYSLPLEAISTHWRMWFLHQWAFFLLAILELTNEHPQGERISLPLFLMVPSFGSVKLMLDTTSLYDSLRVSGRTPSYLLRSSVHLGSVVIILVVFTHHVLNLKNSSYISSLRIILNFFCANCFWLVLWYCDWLCNCHKKRYLWNKILGSVSHILRM